MSDRPIFEIKQVYTHGVCGECGIYCLPKIEEKVNV